MPGVNKFKELAMASRSFETVGAVVRQRANYGARSRVTCATCQQNLSTYTILDDASSLNTSYDPNIDLRLAVRIEKTSPRCRTSKCSPTARCR